MSDAKKDKKNKFNFVELSEFEKVEKNTKEEIKDKKTPMDNPVKDTKLDNNVKEEITKEKPPKKEEKKNKPKKEKDIDFDKVSVDSNNQTKEELKNSLPNRIHISFEARVVIIIIFIS